MEHMLYMVSSGMLQHMLHPGTHPAHAARCSVLHA